MIAIDIIPGKIYVVSGTAKPGAVAIDGYAEGELPCELGADGLADTAQAAEALSKVMTLAGAKGQKASILFSQSEVLAHELELPYEKRPAQFRNMLLGALAQDESTHIMDYTIQSIEDGKARVTAYLSPKSLILQARELLKLAKKQPYCFTVAPHCILRETELRGVQKPRIVVDVAKTHVNYYLMSGEGRIMTRSEEVFSLQTRAASMIAQISKLMQFQIIKYPGNQVEDISLIGEAADEFLASELAASVDAGVYVAECPRGMTAPGDFPYAAYACAASALIEK